MQSLVHLCSTLFANQLNKNDSVTAPDPDFRLALLQIIASTGVTLWRRNRRIAKTPQPAQAKMPATSPGAWSGWRDFRVTRRAFEDAGQTQCSFYLEPLDGEALPPFKPGQYLTFALQIGVDAGSTKDAAMGSALRSSPSLVRCYSLSDQPNSSTYRVTIKRASAPTGQTNLPPGAASSYFHDHVQVGDILKVKAPSGRFFIDAEATTPAVFIAGGIGITPMMSMLSWCLANQATRELHLYYGVRNSRDHAFKQVLQELARAHPLFKLHVAYSSPEPSDVQGVDYDQTGYIDLVLLRNSLAHGQHQFYVCGPPPMMQTLVAALRAWGVNENAIHFEAFGPASVQFKGAATNEPADTTSTSLDIRLSRTGRTLVWNAQDANLLDFMERQGVSVESGCRTGSCGSCETKLISGTVSYADKPDADINQGHCLLCVGKPQSALVLDL